MKIDSHQPDSALLALHEIAHASGRISNQFQTYANYPPLLEAIWHRVKKVLLGESIRRQVCRNHVLRLCSS